MKKFLVCSAFVCAVLLWVSGASAGVIGVTAADDGDGVLTCLCTWDAQTPDELNIDGVHHSLEGGFEPGHVLGDITTDGDPTLKMINSIDNDTGWTWTDYHVNISMGIPFNISTTWGPTVISPGGWTWNITQPVLNGSDYVGIVDYYAGTPVLNGGTLDFAYAITFVGNAHFCQELIPTPEPGTLAMVVGGLLCGLLAFRRRFA